ncbi:MAG TPA: helix-turn-helix domain-containing GNAT family N-acetyltransferase [Acidimicrobiia bacterium]|nr:helix-turn-helix domain-containing GNAT family N-acetyltransferase [Acidimicrobiia bacterium]
MTGTIDLVRAFNRRWTELLGLLDQGLLQTSHSLTEARVIFELAQQPVNERLALRNRLGIDASFLTRVLTRLEGRGLVTTTPSTVDGRALDLALTQTGQAAFAQLDERSREQIAALISPLSASQNRDLVEAMGVISQLLRPERAERSISIRGLRPGDLGWVVQRHGAIYFDEFGWNTDFEALIGTIVTDYHLHHKPDREAAWIVEVDGARAGCVFCCERDDTTAQLRILLVEPWARGLHIGSRLVDECLTFARSVGYASITLWTNDVLAAARRVYEAAGFRLVDEERHHSFGHNLTGQNWTLELT